MVNTTPTPTTLDAYYCENCHGIIASTDLWQIIDSDHYRCPFCDQESLVLLPKEDYQNNFNPESFPYAQAVILKTFFENADNLAELLAVFSRLPLLGLLPLQLEIMPELEDSHILFSPELVITVHLNGIDDYRVTITSDQIHDFSPLLAEN